MNQSCTNYTDLSSLKILMCVKILLRDQIPHSIVCTDPPSHLTWGNFIFVGLLETKFPIANLIYHQDHTLLPNKINWVAATQPIFCVLYKQKTTEVLRQPRPRSELKHQLSPAIKGDILLPSIISEAAGMFPGTGSPPRLRCVSRGLGQQTGHSEATFQIRCADGHQWRRC